MQCVVPQWNKKLSPSRIISTGGKLIGLQKQAAINSES